MANPTIDPSEHVFISGQTGTGKSKLAEIYLAGFTTPVIKLDTKGEVFERRKKNLDQWHGLKEKIDFDICYSMDQVRESEHEKIIYAPSFEELNEDHYNELMKFVYNKENTTLWIDELMEVAPSPHRYPSYLKALYTRGRSKEVSVWACTQRPSDIPSICLANSTHYFIFAMQLPQDRDKISKATGKLEFLIQPTGHDFFYWRIGSEHVFRSRLVF